MRRRFGVYGTPKPGATLLQLEDAIDAAIEDVVANGVTAEELDRTKNRLIADAVYAQDSQATLARWYRHRAHHRLDRRARQRLARSRARRDRRGGAQRSQAWLDKRRSVTGYLIKEHPRREDKRS